MGHFQPLSSMRMYWLASTYSATAMSTMVEAYNQHAYYMDVCSSSPSFSHYFSDTRIHHSPFDTNPRYRARPLKTDLLSSVNVSSYTGHFCLLALPVSDGVIASCVRSLNWTMRPVGIEPTYICRSYDLPNTVSVLSVYRPLNGKSGF